MIKNYRENIWEWFKKNQAILGLCAKGDLLKLTIDSGLGWTTLGLK